MSSHWEIPVHFHCEIFTFWLFVLGALQMESRILFKGEILWLINCQQFITSEGLLNFLLWSHKTCQCLIWTGNIFECFCSSPPCVQVQQNTQISFNIRSSCQDRDNNVFTLFGNYRRHSVDLLSKNTVNHNRKNTLRRQIKQQRMPSDDTTLQIFNYCYPQK